MNILNIIAKKRDKLELSDEEILYFINGVTDGSIPEYQISALLMAIVLNGMNDREVFSLTKCMTESGNQIDLSYLGNKTIDKHSTGGVGDKTTLIVAPIVAALGGKIAKMSGRGLGHTGGTIDKLESIPGFKTTLPKEDFLNQVNSIGISVIGQSENLAPADKKLYALRDITATVSAIPLIASSIMSKKLAAGNQSILLDVKVGSGAFMKTNREARKLAQKMVEIGKFNNRNTMALLTNMDKPLGNCIGNQLEVEEAIEILSNKGPRDLRNLCVLISSGMLELISNKTIHDWKPIVEESLANGTALNKFKEFISMQGGDYNAFIALPEAKFKLDIISKKAGYIEKMNAEQMGNAAMELGAGRKKLSDIIDPAAGIRLYVKPGKMIKEGDKIATLYSNNESTLSIAKTIFEEAVFYSDNPIRQKPLLIDIVK